MMAAISTVSILGCGWYGFELAKTLINQGFIVKGSSTGITKSDSFSEAGIQAFQVLFEAEFEYFHPDFFSSDVVVISIPPKRNSAQTLSYIEKIKRIKAAVIRHRVKRVLFISSTSVYGNANAIVNEHILPQPDTTSGKVILEAESILKDQSEFELTILRFGGLYGPGRDAARFFAGKKNIPNGKSPVNLIHLNDCIEITVRILLKQAFGYTFNACANEHPEKMEFYTQAALISGLEIPVFVPELKEWKIVSSRYIESVLDYKLNLAESKATSKD